MYKIGIFGSNTGEVNTALPEVEELGGCSASMSNQSA